MVSPRVSQTGTGGVAVAIGRSRRCFLALALRSRTGRQAPRRGGVPVTAAVALAIVLAACGTVALPEGDAAPSIHSGPGDGERLTTDSVPIVLDPGEWSGLATTLFVEAYAERDAASVVRTWDIDPVPSDYTFDLPLDGLNDGSSYRFRFVLVHRNGMRFAVEDAVRITLDLGLPPLAPRWSELPTLDRRQPFAWTVPPSTPAAGTVVEYRVGDGDDVRIVRNELSDSVTAGEDLVSPEEVRSGTTVVWRVRTTSSGGVLGPWSEAATFFYRLDRLAPVAITATAGAPSVTALPGLAWRPVAGATAYLLELHGGDGWAEAERIELTEARHRLDIEAIQRLIGRDDTRSIYWRVAARSADGIVTPTSPNHRFEYRPLAVSLETVLPRGATATLVLGSDDAVEADETPAAEVRIARPFAMMRYEVSNDVASALLNIALSAGRLVRDGAAIRHDATGLPVLELDVLHFGRQIGLVIDGERIGVRPGYGSHPAVGVTWYGAAILANELSLLEARDRVYEFTDEAPRIVATRDGYRLPSEVEWALALALDARIAPGQSVGLAEERELSAPEWRGINYQRSGDRWEDVNPPFTAAGGPTNPVGALGYATPGGIYDLLGNVWEWTADWYDPRRYAALAAQLPVDALDGPQEPAFDIYGRRLRAVRGGAWNSARAAIRPGNRGGFEPGASSHSIGFRLARTLVTNR